MKKIYTILFLILISCSKNNETNNIYDTYNDCYAQNFTIKNKSIKYYIKQYEDILIENNLLKDSTANSYVDFLFEFSNYDFIDLKTRYSFLDSIEGLRFGKDALNCVNKISNHKDFKKGIWGRYLNYVKTNSLELNKNTTLEFLSSQPIDSIFNEDTFKYDFFKHKIFNIIPVYDGIQKGKILYKKGNYPIRAEIKIDSLNNVYWNSELINVAEISDKTFNYLNNYSDETIFFLETNRKTPLGKYIQIQNEMMKGVNKFKNIISINKYQKKYNDLMQDERDSINKEFVIKISEQTLPNTGYK